MTAMNDFLMKALHKLRLLPVLIVVATLAFMVRIGDAALQLRSSIGEAQAQEKAEKEATEKTPPVKSAEDAAAEKAVEAKLDKKAVDTDKDPDIKSGVKPVAADDAKTPDAKLASPSDKTADGGDKWQSAEDEGLDDSKVRSALYKDLVTRRQQLDQREKDLAQREALIKAATEEMNKKAEELNSIKSEIQGLLKKQNAEEEANTKRLVGIYEGMKPKDAARIFNALDMDVLLGVVSKMADKKASSIIALMDAEKARALTLLLSEQSKLPKAGASADAGDAGNNVPANFGNPDAPPPVPADQLQ